MDIVNILTDYVKQKTLRIPTIKIWHGLVNTQFELLINDHSIGWINIAEKKFIPYSWPNMKDGSMLNIADPDFFRKFDIILDFELYYDRFSDRIQELYHPLGYDPHFPETVRNA